MATNSRKAKPVQVGDPQILAHPAFRKIPECLFPLQTKAAKDEYDSLARLLYDAGHLTLAKHRDLSSYCAQVDAVHRATEEGRPPRGVWFIQMDKARKRLDLDGISKPIAAPEGSAVNKFARNGFSARCR